MSAVLGAAALLMRTVRWSGFVAGVLVGTVVYATVGRAGFGLLALFFVFGSAVTRIGYRRKAAIEAAEAGGGARSILNVAGKGLVPVACGVTAFLLDRPSWCLVAYTSALAAALGDTTATELGSLLGKRCRTVPGLKAVPPGTPGAVSLEGTALGAVAAALLGTSAAAVGFVPWPAVWIVVVAAVVAGLWESIERRIAGGLLPKQVLGPVLNLDMTLVAAALGGVLWWWMGA